MRSILLLCTFVLAAAMASPAQDSPDYRAPDFAARTFVPGIEVGPTPGLPFTAEETIVWKRPVEGGGTISSTLESRIIRDREGRVYRERHHFGSANATADATLYQFYVMDPVAHTVTICLKPQRVCHIVSLTPPAARLPRPVGSFNGGNEYLDRQTLGTQFMQNLQVQGTLETTTIQPGTFGNDQVLTLTHELWYSPDLQINLAAIRKDPRTGTEDVRVNIVSHTDPDPAALAIPAGYRVEDNRPKSVPATAFSSPSQTTSPAQQAMSPPPSATSEQRSDSRCRNPEPNGDYRIGCGVTAPQVIYKVEPEFSDEARKKKFSGTTRVQLIVSVDGKPTNLRVVKSAAANRNEKEQKIGLSLDRKAIEAVSQYKFKPATFQGKPVPVQVNVEVNFQIF